MLTLYLALFTLSLIWFPSFNIVFLIYWLRQSMHELIRLSSSWYLLVYRSNCSSVCLFIVYTLYVVHTWLGHISYNKPCMLYTHALVILALSFEFHDLLKWIILYLFYIEWHNQKIRIAINCVCDYAWLRANSRTMMFRFFIKVLKFGAVMTTVLPVLFKYCYKYCYSDSRKLWAVMKGGGLAL